jgi:hypothetical protein
MRRGSARSPVASIAKYRARARLNLPSILTASERAQFLELAAANPHLRQTDAPLLAAYTQALSKTHWLGKKCADVAT